MATTFKSLTANDIVNTRTLLHEAIPLTGTIPSGTYLDQNIKTYSHGMFESVFDYPYLSSSANHVFDITCGYSSASAMSGAQTAANPHIQQDKKLNIYNQMAQVLVGYDADSKIQRFDQDGDLAAGGQKLDEVFFINFARLLAKDEIKKQSFTLQFATGGVAAKLPATTAGGDFALTISDYGASTNYFVNSPAGEYGILYTSSVASGPGVGLLYYQAGIAVITGAIFQAPWESGSGGAGWDRPNIPGLKLGRTEMGPGYGSGSFDSLLTGSTITVLADSIRNRLVNISFNNTVELNSTVYFCRVNHNEFNYSSSPTYLSSSQIVVKNSTTDNPVSYITTVGLYSSDNELLAVAKLSEPLKKTPDTELTLRVRLDY